MAHEDGLWTAIVERLSSRDKTLIEGVGGSWTGPTALAEVERLCSVFAARRISPGDRIGILAGNDARFAILLMACARSGLVLVPVNAKLSVPEVATILADAEVSLIFVDAIWRDTLPVLEGVETVDLEDGWARLITHDSHVPEPARSAEETPLLQLYTSGTTGQPKGAVLSHRAVEAIARNGAAHLGGIDDRSVVAICLPLFHIAAILWVGLALLAGARFRVAKGPDPDTVRTVVSQGGATHLMLVPTAIAGLVETLEEEDATLPGLEALVFGAAPMPEALIARIAERLPETALIHAYGLTETAGMFTVLKPNELATRPASCGRPFPGTVVEIRDHAGATLPPGETGEIWTRGPQNMIGYWRKPDATAAALVDGWFRTGDAGSLDEGGFLTINDRIKDMVITGGENVYPAEVESALSHHPDIRDVAVIGLPDARWGEAVTAVIVPREPAFTDALKCEALRDWARGRLAGFKLPRRVHLIEALPRNGAGKVQKHVLRAGMREIGEKT